MVSRFPCKPISMMNAHPESRREPTILNFWLIQMVAVVFFFLALIYHQHELSLLMVLILVVVGISYAWCRMGPLGVRCHSDMDTCRLFPGDTLSLTARVENNKWLPVWMRMRWAFSAALEPVEDDAIPTGQQAMAAWHQRLGFQQDVVARRRGVYDIDAPRVYTSDPLGFFEKPAAMGEKATLIVYPRLVPLRPLDLCRRDLFGMPGARSPVDDPIYLLGTRDYHTSRPARHIHWKASARLPRLQEKVFEPSQQAKVMLYLDVVSFNASTDENDFEQVLEVLATLAVQLDRQGAAVGLAANGTMKGGGRPMIPVTRHARHLPSLLETLARMECLPAGRGAPAIGSAVVAQPGISVVYCCYAQHQGVSEAANDGVTQPKRETNKERKVHSDNEQT